MTNLADYLFNGDTLAPNEVGIEIEAEGIRLPKKLDPIWEIVHDGSLRGHAFEYVLKKPIPRLAVQQVLEDMNKAFELRKSVIEDSGRAGVHIHINVRDMNRSELYNFIVLYLIFENILVELCGTARKGNLFCLRLKDAELVLDYLKESLHGLHILYTDTIRYASMNCKALLQYGSLEFRAMRSTIDPVVLNDWIEVLLCLKDTARTFKNPPEILADLSSTPGFLFAKEIFGEILSYFPSSTDWDEEIFKGARIVQELVYEGNWNEDF